MSKQQNLEFTGEVLQELGNSLFKVRLDIADQEVICTISGKIRKNFIRILAGDRVKLEMSPYDLTRGRIVTRLKNEVELKENSNDKNKNGKTKNKYSINKNNKK